MKNVDNLIKNYPELNNIKQNIENSIDIIKKAYKNGNKVLLCGNGGSASDCSHIQGELMKSFCKKRPLNKNILNQIKKINPKSFKSLSSSLEQGLPTIDLTHFVSLNTALINDTSSDIIYANSILSLGKKGDVLIAISTSGNSKNIINAATVALALGMNVIALSGKNGGELKKYSSENIIVPAKDTYRIQEYHLPIYHAICLELEDLFF